MANVQLAPIHCRNLNAWTAVAWDSTQHSHTGDTVDTVLASYTLPGGSMGPNGSLRITTLWTCNSSAGSKACKIKLGGTQFMGVSPSGTQIGVNNILNIIRNRNNEASQIFMPTNYSGTGFSTLALVTAAIDTADDQAIDFTVQLSNGADIGRLESYLIELMYGA